MSTVSQNNVRIAKNTIFLYLRMLILLAISLYTSRVVLSTLGIEDYGIYNLVAGFITFFTFIGNALVSTMQRFFNTALGKRDLSQYKQMFSMSINTMVLFSIIILLIGETLGLWFVSTKLNIADERYHAAVMVYHFSLLTFIVNMLRTPYHASIVAHEDMSFFAYLSIVESILRLGIVFLLPYFGIDKLIIYGILYGCTALLTNIPYMYFCHKKYQECKYLFKWSSSIFKELVGFSGWMLLGQSSVVLKNQGEAFLINRFFGVVANAAMGVASQVTAAVDMFVANFQTAFNPQIIQTYAAKEINVHRSLIMRASKFSFCLMLIITIPIIANLKYILHIWLVDVPEYTEMFIVLILISHLINSLGGPFLSSILASGYVKNYNISQAIIFISGLFFCYIVLKLGYPPYSVALVAIFIQLFLLASRLFFTKQYSKISLKQYTIHVILPIIIICILSITIPVFLYGKATSFFSLLCIVFIEIISTCFFVYLIGLSKTEKGTINQYLLKYLKIKNESS